MAASRLLGRLPAELLFSRLGHSLVRCLPALTVGSWGSAVAPKAGFVARREGGHPQRAGSSPRKAYRGRPHGRLSGGRGLEPGKSTLLSRFLGSLSDAVVLQAGGDEDESLASMGSWTSSIPMRPRTRGTTRWHRRPFAGSLRPPAGRRLPVVLVLDDLQWADRPSLRAVLFALRRLRADKVLIVVLGPERRSGRCRMGPARRRRLAGYAGSLGWSRAFADLTELAAALGLGQPSHRGAAGAALAGHTREAHALYRRALLDEMGVAALNEKGRGALLRRRSCRRWILARWGHAGRRRRQAFLAAASVWGHHGIQGDNRIGRPAVRRFYDEADEAVASGLLEAGQIPTELGFPTRPYRASPSMTISVRRSAEGCMPAPRRSLSATSAWPTGSRPLWDRTSSSPHGSSSSHAAGHACCGRVLVAAARAFERSAYLRRPDAGSGSDGCSTPLESSSLRQTTPAQRGRWQPAVAAAPAVTRCPGC